MAEQDNVHLADGRGVYEVWFLTFTDPLSGRGYWIRSTYLASRRAAPSAAVWFATFDPADPTGTFGIHHTDASFSLDRTAFQVRVGRTTMSSGYAAGEVEGGGHRAAWRLEWATGEPTYRLLPQWLYRGGLAPTKPFSPNVDTSVWGAITIDDRETEIHRAPAQQGHLFGHRHAERWAWAHCGDFLDADGTVHALTAQTRRGPFLTPFVTFVGLRWEGQWIRLAKIGRKRDFGLGVWRLDMENRRYRLTGRFEAPARTLIRATYEDPDGSPRYCHNTEIASCRLALFERWRGGFEEMALLESRGTTHAEWAGRTPAASVEREFVEVSG